MINNFFIAHIVLGNICFMLAFLFKKRFISIYLSDQEIINQYKKQKQNSQQMNEKQPDINKFKEINIANTFAFYISFVLITWLLFISTHLTALILKKFFLKK